MKVLMINEYGSWGGAEKVFFNSAKCLKNEGFEVKCILGNAGALEDRLKEADISVELYGKSRDNLKENSFFIFGKRVPNILALIKNYSILKEHRIKVEEFIEEFNPDIIYLNNLRPLIIYKNCNIKTKVKVIWHEHGYQRSRIRQIILDNFMLKKIDKIISVSNHTAEKHLTVVKDKIIVINNGIDDIKDKNLSVDNKKKVIFIHPAFITRWKGQRVLLEAVKLLKNKYDEKTFKVQLVGGTRSDDDKKYLEELIEYCDTNNLNEEVEFLGYREDVINLIYNSDILISSSSEHDPFPTILLEGCCLGKGIIASDAGGSSDIVKVNENGFIFKMGDSDELAINMENIINNRELIKMLGEKSRKIYLQNFTLNIYNDNLLKLINKIVGDIK